MDSHVRYVASNDDSREVGWAESRADPDPVRGRQPTACSSRTREHGSWKIESIDAQNMTDPVDTDPSIPILPALFHVLSCSIVLIFNLGGRQPDTFSMDCETDGANQSGKANIV